MIPAYLHAHIAAHGDTEEQRTRARVSLAVSQQQWRRRKAPGGPLVAYLKAMLAQLREEITEVEAWLAQLEGTPAPAPTPDPTPNPPTPPGPPDPKPSPRPAPPSQPAVSRTIFNGENDENAGNDVLARAEGAPAVSDQDVDRAYDGLGVVFDYYWQVHQRDSIDGHGMHLKGIVRYGRDYDNAFWDGTEMCFGTGDGVLFTDFTKPLDVLGHELTHGVSQAACNLGYDNQTGGLNESISDVFGILVKQWHAGTAAADSDWLIGDSLLGPSVQGRALRDMRNPGTAYDDPRLGADPQYGDMADYRDGDDPHISSGIPNKAFATAAVTATGNAWETVGPCWYAALTSGQLSPNATFAEFARLTVTHGGQHADAITSAWQTVGVL